MLAAKDAVEELRLAKRDGDITTVITEADEPEVVMTIAKHFKDFVKKGTS
jgi:hypothetical protein